MHPEKRKALLLGFGFATAVTFLGLLLTEMGGADSAGSFIFVPPIALLSGVVWVLGHLHAPESLGVEIMSHVRAEILILSWLIYFALYLLFAWIVRKFTHKAAEGV
jgi:hypothetical protein